MWVVAHEIVSFGVTELDRGMFHGAAERSGQDASRFFAASAADLLAHPVKLYRNAYNIPPVFMPWGSFIVSDAVREALGEHPNVRYAPAPFGVLFDRPWAKRQDDAEIVDRWLYQCNESWLETFRAMEHRPDLVEKVGPHWELVVPPHKQVASEHEDQPLITVRHPSIARNPLMSFADQRLVVSEEILATCPAISARPCLILRDDLFHRIQPFLDPDFLAAARL